MNEQFFFQKDKVEEKSIEERSAIVIRFSFNSLLLEVSMVKMYW